MAMTPEQTLAEINRKANLGIPVTNSANQAAYDAARNNITQEVYRKADNNISLAGNSKGVVSDYNQKLYDDRVAANSSKVGLSDQPTPVVNENPTSGLNSNNLIDSIYNNNLSSQLQALNKARDTALQGLNGIETQAKQGAYDNRNSADTTNMQNVQRLREIMANNGLTASGENITANASLASDRQSALGQIDRQEQNTLTDVGERRSLINNNAAGDEQSIMQQLQAAKDNMLLNDLYKNKDDAFRDKSFDWTKQTDTAGLTGFLNGQRTLAGNSYDLQKSTTEWNQNFQQGQFDWQKAQQTWENVFQQKNFEQSMREAAASRGLQWASLSQRDKEFVADQAFKEKSFAAQQDQQKLDNTYRDEQTAWLTSPENPKNVPKVTPPSMNSLEYNYVSRLNTFTPEQLRDFFKNEQANIINDLKIDGYNKLYGVYFDSYGLLKKR